jgi:hypothetical protein
LRYFFAIFFLLFPLTAAAGWWCPLGNEIVACEMRDGIVQPPEDEVLLLIFFGEMRDIFRSIAKCESGNKQFYTNGQVIKSRTMDYGYLQINERWIPKAESLGLDIMTLRGNITMGYLIWQWQGLKAWTCSRLIGIL